VNRSAGAGVGGPLALGAVLTELLAKSVAPAARFTAAGPKRSKASALAGAQP
jgi:hypothetical protein